MKDRGEYRSIYAVLVDTREFQELPADARLLWYTLKMSLGALGIGTAYDEQLVQRSGLPRNRFLVARERLERNNLWLSRDGLLYWLRNGLRFEPTMTLTNPNHRTFVAKALHGFPKSDLVNQFAAYYELPAPFPELQAMGSPMGSPIPSAGDPPSHVDPSLSPEHPLNIPRTSPEEKPSLRSGQKKTRAPNGRAHPPIEPAGFTEAWAAYPKRSGSNPKHSALKAWNARIRDGADPMAMLAGVQRFRDFIEATGKTGTEFVMQAARFFGPNHEWEAEWDAPAGNGGKDDDDLGGWRGMTDADVARINADLV